MTATDGAVTHQALQFRCARELCALEWVWDCARTICGTRESPGRTMLRVVSGCNALMELVGADGIEPPTFAL
jgi:hypothetical protein